MSNIILCADDSKTMQTVAEITFRVSDFQYVGALSADEAMDKARAQKPALILADAIMPGKTGYELSKLVKSDPQLSGVPVIVLCGNSAAYDAAKGAEVAADGHLPKPWDSQVMLDKVAELVAKFKSSPVAKLSGGAAAPTPAPAAAKKAVAPAPKPAIPRSRTAKPAAPRPLTAKPAATKASLSVSKIKPPKLGAPKPIPKVGLSKAKEGAGGARTHTIMGMPTIVPPMAKPAIPAAKPTLAAPKPAIPNPLVAKPVIPRPTQVPAKPTLPTRPQTSPSKYAPPAMKSARTKPGAPEPPKPAAKPATPVARRAPTPPPIGKPATQPPRLATPPPVATPAAPVAKQTTGFPLGRPPMIRGLPTKRPAFVAPAALKIDVRRATAGAVARVAAEAGIAADGPEVKALLALSQDVVERVVWEVVPQLAEAIIRENLDTLTAKYQ